MNLIGQFVPVYNSRKRIWEVRRVGPSNKPTRKVWAIYFDGPTAHLDCARRNPPPDVVEGRQKMSEPSPQTLAMLSVTLQYERCGLTVWAEDNGAYSIYRSREPDPASHVGTYPGWATMYKAFIHALRESVS